MSKKTKLELTWIGKDERPRLEPRILLEDPGLSYHAPHRSGAARERDARPRAGAAASALRLRRLRARHGTTRPSQAAGPARAESASQISTILFHRASARHLR